MMNLLKLTLTSIKNLILKDKEDKLSLNSSFSILNCLLLFLNSILNSFLHSNKTNKLNKVSREVIFLTPMK